MIKVNNLSKEFHEQGTSNELLAVDHVDFTIQNGSFCALVTGYDFYTDASYVDIASVHVK